MHFGKVAIDADAVCKLYQDILDLVDEMKASEKLSEDKNTRDKKYYRARFDKAIQRLGDFFKAPILTEEDAQKDVDCLELVRDLLPELTIDNVQKLACILAINKGCAWNDPQLNMIMRRFHRVRYAK